MAGDDSDLSEHDVIRSGTALFIRRPIFAFVLNALIVLAGLAAFRGVEVRELPDVDSPVITVLTDYTGAAPETIDREITATVESAAGRVPGVKSISSSSTFGSSRVTVEFRPGVDIDVAATDLRDAVARVRNALPDDVDEPRIIKADSNASAIMRLAVTSPLRSSQDLTRIVEDSVQDRLLAVPGVADLQIYGDRDPIFRVDVNMMQLASHGMKLSDLATALADMAFDAPAGSLSTGSQSLVVRANATLNTPEAFEAVEIRPDVRLGDVAQVTLGPDTESSVLRANGETGIGMGIIRQAQSNTLDISAGVTAAVAQIQKTLPSDVKIFVTNDSATFVRGALKEVEIALALSILIVTAIIYLFLRDARATLIPVLSVPVSLIGTIAAIWIVGFSVNILTLLALVLATGMVVDDAIVVLENIVRRRAEGMGPRAAAVIGTRQVFFAVLATTTTLAAVFLPLSFLPGQTGGLFREFGFTLAVSIALSAFTALTLSPMLASRMLAAHAGENEARGMVGRAGSALARAYAMTLRAALAAPLVVLALAALFAFVAWVFFTGLKSELVPAEDRGLVILRVQTPQGVSLDYTNGKMRDIEDAIAPFRASGEVTNMFAVAGAGGTANAGNIVVTLADWENRARSQQAIAADIAKAVRKIVGLRVTPIQTNSLSIRGAGQGLSFSIVGDDYAALSDTAARLVAEMEKDPDFGLVQVGYDTTQPQLFVEVDRTRAADLGVSIDGLGEALQAVLDGRKVGTVFVLDKSYDVKLVSTTDPVNDPADLEHIFVQSTNGQMVPVSTYVTLTERAVAPQLSREDQRRSVPITASLAPTVSLGTALAKLNALAPLVLGPDMRILPRAEAATLDETSSGMITTFGIAIIVVFLVLAAQFESFVSAVIVMATVPLGLACAVFALVLTGGTLNVYSQIGLVLIVGIMAKNGILIVEFANQLRDGGLSVRRAIEDATLIRLRPVVMTMVATVLGGLPLVFAFGAGAEARAVLGWIIVGGLGLATFATLYITPVAYLLLAGLSKPKAAEAERLRQEIGQAVRSGAALD